MGYDVLELNLLRDDIAADVALVAVVGPKTAFKPEEVAKLRAAVDGGKPLLAVLGAPEAAGETTGLEDLLRSYNLAIGSNVILDPKLSIRGQPAAIYAPIVGQTRHLIVESLVNRAILMPRATPIQILTAAAQAQPGRAYNPAVLPQVILRTSEFSWAESDLTQKPVKRDDKDVPGPLDVGVAVTDQPGANRTGGSAGASELRPRLVVFSSRYMADNLYLVVEPTNVDLLINAINWLRGQAELGGIAPKSHVALTLAADPILRTRLILVPTVMAALLIIGLGLTTYMARRE
jgi:hypothetical protein